MKIILITGENGYIGNSFVDYVEKKNETLPEEERWECRSISVRDDSWKEEDLAEYDAIVHAAGIVHKKEKPEMKELYRKVNTELTWSLADQYKDQRKAAGKDGQFVFLSTMNVYGVDHGMIRKSTKPNPKSFYGRSKYSAEKALNHRKDENLTVSIVRPPMVYGKDCTGNYARLSKLARMLPAFPWVVNYRSMIYIDNLCEFIYRLIELKLAGTFCPQNEEYVNSSNLVRTIAEANGKRMTLVPGFDILLWFLQKNISVFTKIFGSLTYDIDLSTTREIGDYNVVDFTQSIRLSEGQSPEKALESEEEAEEHYYQTEQDFFGNDSLEGLNEKVSVLMSLYIKEKPDYFCAAMDSILSQTYLPDEIVLMEDGPLTEELYAEVEKYKTLCEENEDYPRLVIHAFEQNQQLGRALAKGITLCSNEFVARMDTDDIALPDRLVKEVHFLQDHPEVSVVGGAIREFNDEGTIDRVKQMPKRQYEIREYVKNRNPLNHMTVMYRKSAIIEAGNYQHFPYLEDYSLWSRMLSMGYQIRNLEDVLVRARTSDALVSRRSGWSYYQGFRKLRKIQHELGLTNKYEYSKAQLGTFTVLMMPGKVKSLLYRVALRD